MFEVRNIAFAYGSKSILRDVSFVVSPGETVSIVGANGAGKTTLMRLLATLAVPDSGRVISEGVDAFSNPFAYRRKLGYLPEKISLYDDMTAKEYLLYRARLKGEGSRRLRRRLGEACDVCRLADSLLREPIRVLSAGQKKRVALADAILLRPKVLLLDDFLAGLDYSMRESLGELLLSVAAFSAVVVTGHEIDDLASWTTRFLVLRDGVISASLPTSGVESAALHGRLGSLLAGGAR